MVTPQGHVLAPRALRKLALHRPVHNAQPLPRRAGGTRRVPHDLRGVPSAPDIDPAHPLHSARGHRHAPPLVRRGRPRVAAGWRPLGAQPPLRSDQPWLVSQPAQNPRLVDDLRRDITPVGPEPAVPPNRGVGFERPAARQQRVITLDDRERPPASQPHSTSRCLSARGSSPPRVLSRVGSWARRPSGHPCCCTSTVCLA